MTLRIEPLAASEAVVEALASLLIEATANGASMSFMHPLPQETALAFWQAALASAQAGGRTVLGAWEGDRLVGSVTVIFDLPPNQPHRAEIAKMVVALDCRRRGLGAALMAAAEAVAQARGRTLLVLDTVPGSDGARLYERMGWTPIGRIPDYALLPHGGLTDTEIYFKRVEAAA
jgi:GNAT superfamily N-acetyltransferase